MAVYEIVRERGILERWAVIATGVGGTRRYVMRHLWRGQAEMMLERLRLMAAADENVA